MEISVADSDEILRWIRAQVKEDNVRITQHAQQEMVEDGFTLDEILEAFADGLVVENYPKHKRGACCLINAVAHGNRPVHIVCTTGSEALIIITVYEPKPPKWVKPTQRRQ